MPPVLPPIRRGKIHDPGPHETFAPSKTGGKNQRDTESLSIKFAPHQEGAKSSRGKRGKSTPNTTEKLLIRSSLAEPLQSLREQGFYFRIHRFRRNSHTYIYLKARKRINGHVKEVTITRIKPEQLEEVKSLIKKITRGINGKTKGTSKRKKGASKNKEEASSSFTKIINSSKPGSQARSQVHGGSGDRGGVGGSAALRVGAGFLFVHRVVLRFIRPWVSPLYLSGFGRVKFVERSKQYILRLEVGVKRWVTVQVNRDGSAQVFLEASNNPLSLEEFIGFCRFYLLWLFRRITGRNVSLEDFIVLVAPEFNIDIDGVNLLEGLQAKSLTLEKFLLDIVRIYYSDPGVKTTMPSGGTRIEARPNSYEGMNLKELIEGVVATAELPKFLSSLKKEVEEVKNLVKGGVSLNGLEKQSLADLIAMKLANYLEILWRRIETRLRQWIIDLATKIAEALQDYINGLLERIRVLEEENKQLRNRIQELEDRVKITNRVEEYGRHPAWRKLEELATPSREFPALIAIDLEKGMVYYSPELWRYIRNRTPSRTLRGLDKQLLDKVRDYYGEQVVKLLLRMQMYGGRIDIKEALNIINANS